MRTQKNDAEVNSILEHLKQAGYWFWTEDLRNTEIAQGTNLLLESLDEFITILEDSEPSELIDNLLASRGEITSLLAVRHSMLATDISAEFLDRVRRYLVFKGIRRLTMISDDQTIEYDMRRLAQFDRALSNNQINSASEELLRDLLFIICYGNRVREFEEFTTFRRCALGEICGDERRVREYLSKLYIKFSRQTTGRSTAESGSIPEEIVREHLGRCLAERSNIRQMSANRLPAEIPGGPTQFDFVYEISTNTRGEVYVIIEVAFQETTNSVIERKARLAAEMFNRNNSDSLILCYVVDGAGYFARESALKKMIRYSDICVGLRPEELDRLCNFMISLEETMNV